VHVFVVNGFDPFDFGGTGDLRTTLNRLGFNKVYSGQFYHAGGFADEIKELAAADPNARFVIVGVGAGVDAAVSLAETVADSGVTIDLLASVDSPFWSNAPGRKPLNVQRVLALHGRPNSWLPYTPSFGEDISLPVPSWPGVSGHPLTAETLATELASIALGVPASSEDIAAVADDSPVPRPEAEHTGTHKHVTSYLDPASILEGRDAVPGGVPAIPVRRESGR
jgi:hypothetical protein